MKPIIICCPIPFGYMHIKAGVFIIISCAIYSHGTISACIPCRDIYNIYGRKFIQTFLIKSRIRSYRITGIYRKGSPIITNDVFIRITPFRCPCLSRRNGGGHGESDENVSCEMFLFHKWLPFFYFPIQFVSSVRSRRFPRCLAFCQARRHASLQKTRRRARGSVTVTVLPH